MSYRCFQCGGAIKQLPIKKAYEQRQNWLKQVLDGRDDVCIKDHVILKVDCMSQTKCEYAALSAMRDGTPCGMTVRYHIVNLSIHTNKTDETDSKHANVVIIDRNRKEYERFEPNGMRTDETENAVNSALQGSEFVEYFSLQDYKYISPADFCPYLGNRSYGPQRFVNSHFSKDEDKLSGTCVLWSMYYTEQRMLDPEMTREDVMKLIASKSAQELNDLITDYAQKLYDSGISVAKHIDKYIRRRSPSPYQRSLPTSPPSPSPRPSPTSPPSPSPRPSPPLSPSHYSPPSNFISKGKSPTRRNTPKRKSTSRSLTRKSAPRSKPRAAKRRSASRNKSRYRSTLRRASSKPRRSARKRTTRTRSRYR